MESSNIHSGIDGEHVYRVWSGMRSAIALRTLSAESVEAYRSIGNVWGEFLARRERPWAEARSGDVRDFLKNLSPSRASKSGPSPVTQKRYFRVLREIYACAVASGWITRNPVDHDAMVSKTEQQDSLVFNRLDWAELYQHLPRATEQVDPLLPWQATRDHSLLLMMMQAGLTVAELSALNLENVEHPRLVWSEQAGDLGLPFGPWEPQSAVPVTLHVSGGRAAQSRTLTLGAPCDKVLLGWLSLRLALPVPSLRHSMLYCSQKSGARLSPKSIFMIAHHHIVQSLRDRYGSDELAHAGPMTLRNSCIVRWLDSGLDDAQVLARAGLKEPQALRRLRMHVHRSADLSPFKSSDIRKI